MKVLLSLVTVVTVAFAAPLDTADLPLDLSNPKVPLDWTDIPPTSYCARAWAAERDALYSGSPGLAPLRTDLPLDLSDPKVTAPVGDIQYNNLTFFRPVGFGGNINGGQGGPIFTVWDPWALREAINIKSPNVVRVMGRIDLIELFEDSPGVRIRVSSDTTITGGDRQAEITGGGLQVNFVHNVIIENIKFHNALSFAPGERPDGNNGIVSILVPDGYSEVDNLEILGSTNVWVDHCEFADDPWNALEPQFPRRHDGLIDIVCGSNWITVSNSIFRNHNHVTLVGNDDATGAIDSGRFKVTFFANWYRDTIQRNPIVRFGEVHVLNNLYTDVGVSAGYSVGVHVEASVFLERNVFINCRRSWGFADGVPNPMGHLMPQDNILQNSRFDDGIPSDVNWRPNQYYSYTPIDVNNVEAHVRNFAGIW